MTKIRRKLRNLLRPWGPCPYHLPPQNQSPWTLRPCPWTPPPEPLYPPHPTGFFFLYVLETSKIRRIAKFAPSLGPGPLPPTPPAPKPLDPPPSPSLGPRGGPRGLFSVWSQPPLTLVGPCPHLPPRHRSPSPSLGPRGGPRGLLSSVCTQPSPFFETAIQPLCLHLPRHQSPWLPPSLGPNPPPSLELPSSPYAPPNPLLQSKPFFTALSTRGHPSKNIIFLFFVRVNNVKNTTQVAKFAPSLGPVPPPPTLSCNRGPWFTALSTRPAPSLGPVPLPPTCPGTKAPGPPLPSPCDPIRRKLRNLLRPFLPPTPPAPKPLDPPPSPSLGPRGLLFSVWTPASLKLPSSPYAPLNPLLQPRPLVYRPVHQASSGGYPPTPQGILQKTSFFFFLYTLETSTTT